MGPLIGGAFLVLLGLYFLTNAIKNFKDFEQSQTWPATSGIITKSDVWRPKATSAHHVWSVEYSYTVNGKKYNGNRAALYTPLHEDIQEWQKGRQENDTTEVYYNPDAPQESVLITGGRTDKKYGEIILSIAALLVGLAVIIGGQLGYLN